MKRYPISAKRNIGRGGPVNPSAFFSFLLGRGGAKITALNGLSLQVKKGEVFGLLGPNGAGKTTLIKILCTLVSPDSGEVFVEGINVQKKPRQALEKLQAAMTYPLGFPVRLTGRGGLEFYSRLYGLSGNEANQRIDDILTLTDLLDRQNDMIQRYSTGMMRRLILCRALLRDSPIILLDEPTNGLDPEASYNFRDLVYNKLSRENGKTVLVSTHNLWEAEQICDRIAIIDKGKILACGKTGEIKKMTGDRKLIELSFSTALTKESINFITNRIETLKGVKSVQITNDNNGVLKNLIISSEGEVDLSELFSIITGNGLRISNLQTSTPTLEDIFLKLVKEGDN